MDGKPATVDGLRSLYAGRSVARAFFDHIGRRERDQTSTRVARIRYLLHKDGYDFKRSLIIELFRELEQQNCGRFIEARRGLPSRFKWSVSMINVARAAAGSSEVIGPYLPPINGDHASDIPGSVIHDEERDKPIDFLGLDDVGGGDGLEEETKEDDDGETVDITEPFDPGRIRVETKPMVIQLLLDRIKNNEIDLAPDFQRKAGIWSKQARSQLIESLLIRIPLPAFYMDGSDENKWLVVDGLQRLSTLKSFVLDKSLQLTGLEFLNKSNGSTFDDLPRGLQRRILETQVTVFLIQENTPPEVKFNIFKRINTGGLPLSAQEIRHALYQGKAARLLKDLAAGSEFKDATNNGIRDDRMGDRECILRAIAFMRTNYRLYRTGNLDTFLNVCMRQMNEESQQEIDEVGARFNRAMVDCRRLFGKRAFRKQTRNSSRRYPINRALFEVWASNIEQLYPADIERLDGKKTELNDRFLGLLYDADFEAAISYGTGDPRKVNLRFSEIERIIKETLRDKGDSLNEFQMF